MVVVGSQGEGKELGKKGAEVIKKKYAT